MPRYDIVVVGEEHDHLIVLYVIIDIAIPTTKNHRRGDLGQVSQLIGRRKVFRIPLKVTEIRLCRQGRVAAFRLNVRYELVNDRHRKKGLRCKGKTKYRICQDKKEGRLVRWPSFSKKNDLPKANYMFSSAWRSF